MPELVEEGDFIHVTLACDDQRVQAHKFCFCQPALIPSLPESFQSSQLENLLFEMEVEESTISSSYELLDSGQSEEELEGMACLLIIFI